MEIIRYVSDYSLQQYYKDRIDIEELLYDSNEIIEYGRDNEIKITIPDITNESKDKKKTK